MNFIKTLACERQKRVGGRRTILALTAMLAGLLLCVPAFSQSGAGTIQGTVFDQTGAAIAGAAVTVVDATRGISRPFTADSAGQYVALDLTPGAYTVRGEFKGFQTVEHANVIVEVGKTIRVDLTLQPGAQTQTVTVTSEAPSVDTTDATLGGTVENSVMNALPLNGRNFQRLLELRPGVVTSVGGSSGTASTNGLRTGDDLQLVDGIAAFAASTGNSVLNSGYRAGDSTSLLPIDAIQEFNTAQNPKAEYGWKAGSIVNLGIKSGTNTIHGTAYAFGRDTSLDAANPFLFNNTSLRTPLELEQYGATAGGPIVKNKIFWFAGYEGLRWAAGVTTLSTIPEDVFDATDTTNLNSMLNACNFLASKTAIGKGVAANNNLPGGYNAIGVAGPNGSVNALSAQISGISINPVTGCSVSSAGENFFPTNNTTSTSYNPNLTSTSPGNNGIFKGTYHISDHNEVSGMFFRAQQNEQVAGPVSSTWGTFVPAQTQAFDGLWTWTPNSTWVNEFRGGLAYLNNQTLATDRAVNPASPYPTGYGIPTGVNLAQFPLYGGAPELQVGSFSFLGAGPKTSVRGPEGSIDLVEHLSYLRGKHAFKFGFEYLDAIFDGNTYNQGNGDVIFGTLQTFLSGNADGGGQILLGNPKINARSHNYAFFAQDDWRVKTRVTVNLGLRWTITTPFSERNNYVGNFNPNVNPATTPAIEQAGPGQPLSQLYSTDWKAISPRLGLAWDVQGNGKTVIRVGGSIVYGLLGGGDIVNTMPFGANFPTVNTAANPAGINTSGTDINAHTSNLFLLNANQVQWNTTGPVFPGTVPVKLVSNGVTYTGVTCLPSTAAVTVQGVPGFGVPCSANVMTPNFIPDTPVGEWNLDIQRAITNNLTIDVAYVGNHAWNIPSQEMDVNQPAVGAGWNGATSALTGGMTPANWCLASAGDATPYDHCLGKASSGKVGGTAASTLVTNALLANEAAGAPYASKFPYLSYIDQTGNAYHSNYNGLQVTVSMRATHGLNFLAGYTFAHALDNVSGEGSTAGPMDIYHPNVNYGNSSNDIRNRFTFSASYAVPGHKAPGQLLEGWSVNTIFIGQGGSPWWAADSTNDFSGTGEVFAATSSNATSVPFSWNYTGPKSAFTAGAAGIPCYGLLSKCVSTTIPQACITAAQAPYAGNATLMGLALAALDNNGCYMQNGGILTPPAYGTIGNMPRNDFRGKPYYNVDFSVTKDWKFRERFGIQFRSEFFNLFNFADYANPSGSALSPTAGGAKFGIINATLNSANPVLGSGGPRVIQFGLKLSF